MDTRKNILAIVGTLIGTIVLGAIGSGLWERCFSPLFDYIVKVVVSGMSLLSNTYKNGIYEEAAKGLHEYSSLFLHAIVMMMIITVYLTMLIVHPLAKQKTVGKIDENMRTFVRSRSGYYTIVIITVIVVITCFLELPRIFYINSVATITRQSISILAPHVQDQDVKELWAIYSSMTSAHDFKVFTSRLEALAKEKSITLPKYPELWTRKPNKTDDPLRGSPAGQP